MVSDDVPLWCWSFLTNEKIKISPHRLLHQLVLQGNGQHARELGKTKKFSFSEKCGQIMTAPKKWCLFMCIISPFTDVTQDPEIVFEIIHYKCDWKRCCSWNPPSKIMSLPPIKPDLNHTRAPLDAGGIQRAGCCEGAQVHIYTSLLPACVQCITSLSFHQGPQQWADTRVVWNKELRCILSII